MATTDKKGDARSCKVGTAPKNDSYFGGKGQDGVFHTIINQIPPCDDYWELFAGNASIYRKLKYKPKRCFLVEKYHSQAKRLANNLGVPCFGFDFVMVNVLNGSMYQDGTYVVWGSAFDVLEVMRREYIDKHSSFFFIDPPYLLGTRTSTNRYKHELTDEEHQRLLDWLITFKNAKMAITTYPNETYQQKLEKWRIVDYKSVTRSGEVRVEHLFMNYPSPQLLQDPSYFGANYREREAYNKQQRNWLRKFQNMPPAQQQIILYKLYNHFNDTYTNA